MEEKKRKIMFSKLTLTLLDGTIIVTKHPRDYIIKELEPFSKYNKQLEILLVGDDLHKDEVPDDIYKKGIFGQHDLRELYKDNKVIISEYLSIPVIKIAEVKLEDIGEFEFDNVYKIINS